MHPLDCPQWEYSKHSNSAAILKKEINSVLIGLRNGEIESAKAASDTRRIHYRLFRMLTPKETPYYAGHYRGENFRCLKFMMVSVCGDPRVGYPPHQVFGFMTELGRIIKESVASLDQGMLIPNSQLSLPDKLLYLVAAVSRIFELFLRIHPYVNGNGHIARFCVWVLLGRYGFWPKEWPIEPRPDDPPYTELIIQYRNGNKHHLEQYILQRLEKQ